MGKTLLERMGGVSMVGTCLDGMHERMLADDKLAPFLLGIDLKVLAGKQNDFLGRVLGASEYDAAQMYKSHKGLVERGLTDEHFDLTVKYFRQASEKAGVPENCITELVQVIENTRGDVLCRTTY